MYSNSTRHAKTPRPGERSSKRVRNQPPPQQSSTDGFTTTTTTKERLLDPPKPLWSAVWLRDATTTESRSGGKGGRRGGGGKRVQWDLARMHQHLELSDSKSTVCTTGYKNKIYTKAYIHTNPDLNAGGPPPTCHGLGHADLCASISSWQSSWQSIF